MANWWLMKKVGSTYSPHVHGTQPANFPQPDSQSHYIRVATSPLDKDGNVEIKRVWRH